MTELQRQHSRRNTFLATAAAVIMGQANGPGQVALASEKDNGLQVVPNVDLKRYMGSWFEIARFPNIYQRGLVAVVATYSLQEDGKINVLNTARARRLDGAIRKTTADAYVVKGSHAAKWKVQFLWPFEADYWIIDLGKNYEYAVVGQPSRKNLWILCRKPQMDEELYAEVCERLRHQGYDPDRLKRTPHLKSK